MPAPTTPPGLALVRLLASLVPSPHRAEWVAEWEGELTHAWLAARQRGDASWVARAGLILRTLGAVTDALWLRRRHGAGAMLDLDLKYAVRTLRRRPGFATVVVLTLALGIGATTAIFSVVHGVLLRPLAVPEAERVVALHGHPTDGDTEKVGTGTSHPDFMDIRAQATAFDALAALRSYPSSLTDDGGEPARVQVSYATEDFWRIAGALPALGRSLLPSDARPEAPAVAVLSHALWQTRYGGDPAVVGRSVRMDDLPVTIVGVMTPELRLASGTQVWRPLVPDAIDRARGAHRLNVIGRLAPGVTLEGAAAEVRAIARRLELQYPQDNAKRSARLEPLHESIVGDTRAALFVLLGAVSLVLLVGCANLASLFLARAAARGREMALRTALGAGRGRLIRQWMTESLLLTTVGGLAGLLVAWAGLRALLLWAPQTVPRADEIALDLPVLLFLLGASVVTGLLFGLLPALQLRRGDPSLAFLKDGGRGTTAGAGRRQLRQGFVVAEVALATMLVVGAALLLKSFWQLSSQDPGFRPDGLLVAQLQLPTSSYDSTAKVVHFYGRLQEEIAAIPGVEVVSVAYEHPLGPGWTSSFAIAGRPTPPPGTEPEARVRPVWPGYFRTVGVPLVRGRDVQASDRFDAPGAVLVNEAFVRRHFPRDEPLGARLQRGAWWPGQPTEWEIVGVVADEPLHGPGGDAEPATYFAHAQFPMNDMWVVVRASPSTLPALGAALRARVWRLDAKLPVENVHTMRELLAASVAEPRFTAALLALFAGAALLLAAVGIYGVLSYTVAQRTGEIGVRMALGAERGRVVRQVMGNGLALSLAGVALGMVGALGMGRMLSSLLVGVSAHDPLVLGGVASLLTVVALAAAWLPARRASRVEPVVALRYE